MFERTTTCCESIEACDCCFGMKTRRSFDTTSRWNTTDLLEKIVSSIIKKYIFQLRISIHDYGWFNHWFVPTWLTTRIYLNGSWSVSELRKVVAVMHRQSKRKFGMIYIPNFSLQLSSIISNIGTSFYNERFPYENFIYIIYHRHYFFPIYIPSFTIVSG